MPRTNKTICVSFGQDEKPLLSLLDEGRKTKYHGMTRSSWIKQKIREEFGNKEEKNA